MVGIGGRGVCATRESSLVVESSPNALSPPQRAQVDELVVTVLVSSLVLSGERNRARRHRAHCNCSNPHQPCRFHWVSPFQSDESALGGGACGPCGSTRAASDPGPFLA